MRASVGVLDQRFYIEPHNVAHIRVDKQATFSYRIISA